MSSESESGSGGGAGVLLRRVKRTRRRHAGRDPRPYVLRLPEFVQPGVPLTGFTTTRLRERWLKTKRRRLPG